MHGLLSQIGAVGRLAARVLGDEIAEGFRFEPLAEKAERETFQLDQEGGSIVVRGNSGPALASGLYHYLTNHAHAHISWNGSQPGRVREFPPLGKPVRRESWARWRYFLNYCCFSYSLAFWQWEEWEPLIDWMALHGVNLPLAMTGQEAVWRAVGKRMGLTEGDLRAFLPGPAYLPFGWMGCLDGWEGPLPDDWITAHEALGRRILNRQRELGMTPVLQGFTGHVPRAFRDLHPGARIATIRWEAWETDLLDPTDPLFREVATLFLEEQSRLFGTSHFYAADPFIEMVPPSGEPGYLAGLARAIHDGMTSHDPNAVWVLQGWPFHFRKEFWTQDRFKAFLDAVPDERLLLLDLFCESYPMWEKTGGFCGKPWLWCNVQSFGQNTLLSGALEANNTALRRARNDSNGRTIAGIGMVNEGLCENAVAYDFLFSRAWHDAPVELARWGREYAIRRYGRSHAAAEEAWELLATGIYRAPRLEDSAVTRCPSLPSGVPAPGEAADLARAWKLLLEAGEELNAISPFRFDLVHLGRQVLSNLASRKKALLNEAIASANGEEVGHLGEEICTLLGDLSELLAAEPAFRLERWLASAERWGSPSSTPTLYRRNALRQITLWGSGDTVLRDYARKEWAGLVRHFYLPRWKAWLAFVMQSLENGKPPEGEAFRKQQASREERWIAEGPVEDPPSINAWLHSSSLFAKYIQ